MYKVIFIDGTVFEGGQDLMHSNWNEMPPKLITSLEYRLGRRGLKFQGFEAYNHIVEKDYMFNGRTQIYVPRVYVMGKKGEKVFMAIYDYEQRRFYTQQTTFGKEIPNHSIKGWKKGFPLIRPKVSGI